jgi:hypothetical protein
MPLNRMAFKTKLFQIIPARTPYSAQGAKSNRKNLVSSEAGTETSMRPA